MVGQWDGELKRDGDVLESANYCWRQLHVLELGISAEILIAGAQSLFERPGLLSISTTPLGTTSEISG